MLLDSQISYYLYPGPETGLWSYILLQKPCLGILWYSSVPPFEFWRNSKLYSLSAPVLTLLWVRQYILSFSIRTNLDAVNGVLLRKTKRNGQNDAQ